MGGTELTVGTDTATSTAGQEQWNLKDLGISFAWVEGQKVSVSAKLPTPPVLLRAYTGLAFGQNMRVILEFDKNLDVTAAALPPVSSFTIVATGDTLPLDNVKASGDRGVWIDLKYSNNFIFRAGEQITVSYVDPTSDDDDAALQGSNGQDVASFTGFSVTNNSTVLPVVPASPPRNLVATANGKTSISLAWDPPVRNGGSPITGYSVLRSASDTGPWVFVSPEGGTGTADTTFEDSGLSPGTTYYYQLGAINAIGGTVTSENVTLTAVSRIASATTLANDAATGKPAISGTAQVGRMLTATTSGITDPDGNTKAENGDAGYAYTYQWVQVDGGTETDIAGETSSTYTPSSSDVGKTIKVKVSFTDDLGSAEGPLTSDATVAVAAVTVAVSIAADHDRIGAGLEDLDFTLMRQGAATAALEATVTIVQDRSWLGTSDLSHTVTIAAGSPTATLTLAASRFSFDPDTSGDLTATVTGAGIAGGEATVEMVSTADAPITISYDKSSYTFAENATDVEIYVVATLDPAYPQAPSRSFQIALSTASDTATFRQDFVSVTWQPYFVHGDFARDGNRFVARKRLQHNDGTYFGVENDDVYEGSERLVVKMQFSTASVADLMQFARPNGDTCEAISCSPIVTYPVFITDEEDLPVLSLGAAPASISEADDTTTGVAENVSTLTVAAASPKTFATGQTVTLTFGGSAVYGTHYGVSPVDADTNTGGHQVVLPAETGSVELTVTAADNAAVDGGRTIEVVGSLDGTEFDRASIAVADDERANTAPAFVDGASADREVAENTAAGTDIGAPVRATDPENDTLEYSLDGTDAASFDIDPDTGQLRAKTGVDYDHEAKSSYSVTVAVNDGYGGADTIAVTVGVTDEDEPPLAPAAPGVAKVRGSVTSLKVSWRAPDNAGRPAIAHYDLRYRAGETGRWRNGPQGETGTSATIGTSWRTRSTRCRCGRRTPRATARGRPRGTGRRGSRRGAGESCAWWTTAVPPTTARAGWRCSSEPSGARCATTASTTRTSKSTTPSPLPPLPTDPEASISWPTSPRSSPAS